MPSCPGRSTHTKCRFFGRNCRNKPGVVTAQGGCCKAQGWKLVTTGGSRGVALLLAAPGYSCTRISQLMYQGRHDEKPRARLASHRGGRYVLLFPCSSDVIGMKGVQQATSTELRRVFLACYSDHHIPCMQPLDPHTTLKPRTIDSH